MHGFALRKRRPTPIQQPFHNANRSRSMGDLPAASWGTGGITDALDRTICQGHAVTSRRDESQIRVISLGKALLDRLRSGLTSKDLIHRSDQLPPSPSPSDLDEVLEKVAGGS